MIVLLRARSRTTATSAPKVPPPTTTARVALGAPSHCPCSMFSSPLFSFDLKSYVSHDAMAHSCLMRSEDHTSELQSLMRISYAVFCLKKKNKLTRNTNIIHTMTKQPTPQHNISRRK